MRKNQTFWLFVIGLFAALAMVALRQDEAQTKPRGAEAQTPLAITASDLYDAYDRNEVAATEVYRGRLLRVSGTIDSIGIDRDGISYVDFRTRGMGVRANFNNGHTEGLARLSKGQIVTVQCIGLAKTVVVHMRDCTMTD